MNVLFSTQSTFLQNMNFSDDFYSNNSYQTCNINTQNSTLHQEQANCDEFSNVSSSDTLSSTESSDPSLLLPIAVLVNKSSEVKRISEKFPSKDQSQNQQPVKPVKDRTTKPKLRNQFARRNEIYFARLKEVNNTILKCSLCYNV